MKKIIFLIFLLSFLICVAQSIRAPNPESIDTTPTNITYRFKDTESYYTNWTMKYNSTSFVDVKVSFDCKTSGGFRICSLITNRQMSRLFGTTSSTFCAMDSTGTICYISMTNSKVPSPINVKFSSRPPTKGGDIIVTGNYLRLLTSQLNYIQSSTNAIIKVKGDFEDPNFDCNNLTLTFPPGSGKMNLMFDLSSNLEISYASPIIDSVVYNQANSKFSISGDNFSTKKQLINILFNGVSQNNFSITQNDTAIEVENYIQNNGGPILIQLSVNNVSMSSAFSYCLSPITESINSISNHIGGIITIKGSYFNNAIEKINVTIGNKDCKVINSTLNEIQCQMDPNEIGGSNLKVLVNIDGCINNSSSKLEFTYGRPTINSYLPIKSNDTTVTIVGINFGLINETIVRIEGLQNDITPISISNDETQLVFSIHQYKCKPIVSIIHNNISSNSIKIQTQFSIYALNAPFISNATLDIALVNYDCSNTEDVFAVIVIKSTFTSTCSKPIIKPNSEYYSTTCPIVPSTGKRTILVYYKSEQVTTQFLYMAPILSSFGINNMTVTVNGLNFGYNTSLIKATFSGRNPHILTTNDNKFTFDLFESDYDSPISIVVDGIDSQSQLQISVKPTPSPTSPPSKPVKTDSSSPIISINYNLFFSISLLHLIVYKLFL
ncbi:hypothetical protein RB653_003952 [Dictyostelium firmibasis]|uniref:IPT/TIG domain-containing protein n=1 Tax=Dictyostelium firmibasis TaxID=79012 RepID=A0AAN7TYM6_9MYCE